MGENVDDLQLDVNLIESLGVFVCLGQILWTQLEQFNKQIYIYGEENICKRAI